VITFMRLPTPRPKFVNRGPVSAIAYHDQKVWDTGTAGWCYYTKTTVDPTPDAGETTPNYTGAISSHVVIGTRTA
jgi:hypothetical protein